MWRGRGELRFHCNVTGRDREAQRTRFLEESWDLSVQGQKEMSQARQGRDGTAEWVTEGRTGAGPCVSPAPGSEPGSKNNGKLR